MSQSLDSLKESSQRFALVGFLLVGVVIGFLIGRAIGAEVGGADPAMSIAREYGWALPEDQTPAFADGTITRAEVEQALDRLTKCVEQQGVSGFDAVLDSEGSLSLEHSGSVESYRAFELCRIRQLDATYNVWRTQQTSLTESNSG